MIDKYKKLQEDIDKSYKCLYEQFKECSREHIIRRMVGDALIASMCDKESYEYLTKKWNK
jgi:hypothetical protein